MFTSLIGNPNVKRTLTALVARGRVPASLILAGPDGVGKRRFAVELARALLCSEPAEGGGCGVCSICVRVGTFAVPGEDEKDARKRVVFSDHPDVGLIVPVNRTVPVDSIRHLETEANFRPFEAASRLFIIDNADKMNDAAANALLKTLEEPPPGVHIVLVTSRPDSLLPTIRSRCQLIRFAPVPSDEIEKFLVEDRAFTHDEARLAAKVAQGSVSRAVTVDVPKFRRQRDKMLDVVRAALSRDNAKLLKTSEELTDAKNKEEYEDSLNILESLIHDIWSAHYSQNSDRMDNVDLADDLKRLAAAADPRVMESWLAEIATLREDLNVNINRRVATDALFVGMSG